MLWWIAIVFIIILVVVVYNKYSKMMNHFNPIDSIRYNGTLGFCLGDSKNLSISRVRHLNLLSKQELNAALNPLIHTSLLENYIRIAHGVYNNVDHITLIFDSQILSAISITFDTPKEGIPSMKGTVERIIGRVLGTPYLSDKSFASWQNRKYRVVESIENNTLSVLIGYRGISA